MGLVVNRIGRVEMVVMLRGEVLDRMGIGYWVGSVFNVAVSQSSGDGTSELMGSVASVETETH